MWPVWWLYLLCSLALTVTITENSERGYVDRPNSPWIILPRAVTILYLETTTHLQWIIKYYASVKRVCIHNSGNRGSIGLHGLVQMIVEGISGEQQELPGCLSCSCYQATITPTPDPN